LIVQSKIGVPFPQSVCWCPPDQAIPPGWEELEVVKPSRLEKADPCRCGHSRISHTARRYQCLERRGEERCDCVVFREPTPEAP
jgi:hypothetical protein